MVKRSFMQGLANFMRHESFDVEKLGIRYIMVKTESEEVWLAQSIMTQEKALCLFLVNNKGVAILPEEQIKSVHFCTIDPKAE